MKFVRDGLDLFNVMKCREGYKEEPEEYKAIPEIGMQDFILLIGHVIWRR